MKVVFTLLLLALLGFSLVQFTSDQELTALKLRAAEIFKFDNSNTGLLPAGRVTALSIALAFHDTDGAKKLIQELEEHKSKRSFN